MKFTNKQIAKFSIDSLYEMVKTNMCIDADSAIQINSENLKNLHDSGSLTDSEYRELRIYNRKEYSELPLEV